MRRKPEPAQPACDCAGRFAELEETVAALARAAVRAGHAKDVIARPNGSAMVNHHDAVLIRAAASTPRKETS